MRYNSIDERIEKAGRIGAIPKTVNKAGFKEKVKAKTEQEKAEHLKKQKELQEQLLSSERNLNK